MPLLLCRHLDRRTEWRVSVAEGDFTIGCSDAATVPVPDRTIDAKEVLISRKGDSYLLQDIAEKGRVLLAGTVTRSGILKDGDPLRVGRVAVIFFEDQRAGARQVELSRDGSPSADAEFARFSEDLGRGAFPGADAEASAGLSKAFVFGTLAASLAAGLALGIVATRDSKEAHTAPFEVKKDAPAERASSSRQLNEALKQLKETLEKKEAEVRPRLSAEPGAPADATASRVVLFRLFIDLAGRPPTRGEARDLWPLDHEARWRKIVETARREGTSADLSVPAEAQFISWLGRAASPAELKDVAGRATPDRPAAYWISAGEEYRRAERRRARSPLALARSFIVDLVDRPPASPAETETVRAALEAPGGALEAARTLVYSREARVEPAGSDAWWEDELFRFLLRSPREKEREEIPRILGTLEPGARRAWLLLALASLEEYRSY